MSLGPSNPKFAVYDGFLARDEFLAFLKYYYIILSNGRPIGLNIDAFDKKIAKAISKAKIRIAANYNISLEMLYCSFFSYNQGILGKQNNPSIYNSYIFVGTLNKLKYSFFIKNDPSNVTWINLLFFLNSNFLNWVFS